MVIEKPIWKWNINVLPINRQVPAVCIGFGSTNLLKMEDPNVNQAKNKNVTNIELPKMLMDIYHGSQGGKADA